MTNSVVISSLRLKGKIALVTGASKGIGASIATAFAREGARVLVNYLSSEAGAKEVVDSILKSGGKAWLIKADISDPQDVGRMFDFISKKFGRLDILMNNAGAADASIWNAKLSEITPAMWQKVIAVDVIGGFLCDQRAALLMKKGGVMINIASTPVLVGDTQGLVYACAKASVLTKTKMLARMLAPKIRVNCMILGSIETGWVDWLDKETLKSYESSISLGRFGKPDEVAKVAVFLASDDSSYITGESVVVDGGDVLD
ncbi:MAG: glucose 1-dehydrogenase [Thaumarchaeota archaeon]|nr:glucose 1-dehydrogenase [Nitrososphaerota archaeon]